MPVSHKKEQLAILPPTVSLIAAVVGLCLVWLSGPFDMPVLAKFGSLSLTASMVGFGVYLLVLILTPANREPHSDSGLLDFLRVVFVDWTTRMSGPLSVPFAALAIWSTQRYQKIIWVALAILSLMVAFYRVWSEERKTRRLELEALRSQLSETVSEKNAEIAKRDQVITDLTSKPKRSLAEQRDYETAKNVLERVGPKGMAALRHLRAQGAQTFGFYPPSILPPGMSADELRMIYSTCASAGVVSAQDGGKPGRGETTYSIAPPMRTVLAELLAESDDVPHP